MRCHSTTGRTVDEAFAEGQPVKASRKISNIGQRPDGGHRATGPTVASRVVVQIESASYRLRERANLIQFSADLNATAAPKKRRGKPPQNKGGSIYNFG